MEQTAEKRGYLLEDYRLFHLKDAQGTRIDYHYHEFYKLLLLHSGSGGYTVEDCRYLLEAGDIILIPSRVVHRPEFESGMPYERTIIYIDPDFLMRCSTKTCELQQLFASGMSHVVRLEPHGRKEIFSLAERLEKELLETGCGQEILQNATLLRLLVYILRALQNPEQMHPAVAERATGRILEIQRYLDAHLEEELSIDTIAERFFISKYHMMRQFRRETGMSVHAYLSERRLFLARERIRQGMSAAESCFRSGFGSYSAFTRAYAKRFGTTPTGREGVVARREETFE